MARCRSTCEELEKYNLFNQEGGRARGPDVGKCKRRIEKLREAINNKLNKVRSSRTARWVSAARGPSDCFNIYIISNIFYTSSFVWTSSLQQYPIAVEVWYELVI